MIAYLSETTYTEFLLWLKNYAARKGKVINTANGAIYRIEDISPIPIMAKMGVIPRDEVIGQSVKIEFSIQVQSQAGRVWADAEEIYIDVLPVGRRSKVTIPSPSNHELIPWLDSLAKELLEDFQPVLRLEESLTERGKPGRPHLPEDTWAWEQVNIEHREQAMVFKEWQERVKTRNLVDPERQFNRIIKPEWYR